MANYVRYVCSSASADADTELARVDAIADQLHVHLGDTARQIAALHVHGAGSSAVQAHVSLLLKGQLGFEEEVVTPPQGGFTTRARPDFYYSLGQGRGILAEVERGGTITNNHDLKDMWKAHLSPVAQHLFLIVPVNNWRADGRPREKAFQITSRRLAAFFGEPRREVDVLSVHIFGY